MNETEIAKWFTIGWGSGVLVMAAFTWWLVKSMLRDFYKDKEEEYKKYTAPKYEVRK